jgi:hypothetical protein
LTVLWVWLELVLAKNLCLFVSLFVVIIDLASCVKELVENALVGLFAFGGGGWGGGGESQPLEDL